MENKTCRDYEIACKACGGTGQRGRRLDVDRFEPVACSICDGIGYRVALGNWRCEGCGYVGTDPDDDVDGECANCGEPLPMCKRWRANDGCCVYFGVRGPCKFNGDPTECERGER